MLIVQDKLISEDIIDQQFVCNLKACKGACCWEGDFGAPLEKNELKTLDKTYEEVKDFLTEEGKAAIEKKGTYAYYKDMEQHGTTLIENKACAFMTTDPLGVAQCGIEQAWKAGQTQYRKPISCQLYPIRANYDERVGLEMLNYDRWDICSAACELGEKVKVPVYQFLKDALVRKYGEDFYEELDAAAQYLQKK